MDIRHFEPASATEVTKDLAEARPEKNKLYRVDGSVYKATSYWLADIPELAGQRRISVTVSRCDEAGQALRDEAGNIALSEPHILVVSAGLPKTPAEQIDENTRRWVVAFHHISNFWGAEVLGVAAPKASAPADLDASAA